MQHDGETPGWSTNDISGGELSGIPNSIFPKQLEYLEGHPR